MKNIIFLASLLMIVVITISFIWIKLYHPQGPLEEIQEQGGNSVEVLIQDKSNELTKIESGMIFGSLETFKNANKNLRESESLSQFISENYVYAGWLIDHKSDDNTATRIYWNKSFYCIVEKNYKLTAEGYVSPDNAKYFRQVENNALDAGFSTFFIVLAASIVFISVEYVLSKSIGDRLGNCPSQEFPKQENVPQKFLKKSGQVKVLRYYDRYFIAYGKHSLGYVSTADSFLQFIKKFGKRNILYWLNFKIIGVLGLNFQANIDYNLLLAGYLLFKRDKKSFADLTKKARNPKEFLSSSGIC